MTKTSSELELTPNEANTRLASLRTVYGVGTRSYNRSAEKRESDRQRKAATEKYLQGERIQYIVGPICNCRSFNYPHEIKRHRELRNNADWRTQAERT